MGGCILACNHRSNLDPLIMGATTLRPLTFMAKEELFQSRFGNWYYSQVGAFPVKRDTSDFKGVREAIRRLKKGRLLIVFPEGTRGTGGRIKKVNPGIGFLVRMAQVPVLPVYLKDTDKALPEEARWVKPQKVTITIGEPLHFQKDLSNIDIANTIMDKIQSLGDSR